MASFQDFGIDVPMGARGDVKARCPECSHTHSAGKRGMKDLSVNIDKGVWNCHRCGWKGGLEGSPKDDWREREFPPAPPTRQEERRSYEKPRPIPKVVNDPVWQGVVDWFADRGISENILARMGVTSAREFCPVCMAETEHILFPFTRGGEHKNTKHRCASKHFRQEKDAERLFYNVDAVRDAIAGQEHGDWPVIIVEGEVDALSVLEADSMASVISVPDGAPNPNTRNYSAKFDFMKGDEAALNDVRWFVIAVDADEPGATLQEELIRRLGPERCRRVSWPEGIKDANEYLIQYGPKALKAHLDKAQPVPVVGIMTADDVAEELDRLYEHGVDEGIRIGMGALDDHYRIKAPGISVITGIPGHGKSGVLDNILVKLAENHGWHTALFSPEQMPVEMHAKQMMMIHTGKPFDDGPTMRMSRSEMHAAREWVSQHFSFIVPENPTIERIVELAKIECFRHGTKAIVIDPWNELADLAPANMTETQYVQHCLRLFRALALNLKIHIFIVAHPTKLRMKDDGTEPVPTLYDIAGSANFRNKADFGISIWRDLSVDDPNVSIFIQKVRWREQGKIGRVNMNYNPVNRRVQSERPVAGMTQRGAW